MHQCEDGEAIIITKNGKPSVALINIEDEADLESLVLSSSKQFQHIIEESRRSFQRNAIKLSVTDAVCDRSCAVFFALTPTPLPPRVS
ncbi:type II toxin-antitoxin system prevent-host-death family antitoxin [Candidatus Thiosymbion oneisti]|uniref:type II toxin-antitoxin system prevent-host-death family antitoxin n=1 Tax=Candidatus Thiosymbion oneisti TaxID=589554 RepID=UPI00105EE00F